MLREFILYCKIIRLMNKEQIIRGKLYDTQIKMTDLYTTNKEKKFKTQATYEWMEFLRKRLLEIRKEMKNG